MTNDPERPQAGAGFDAVPERIEEAGTKVLARREALHAAIVDLETALATSPAGGDTWFDEVRAALGRMHLALRAHTHDAELPDGLLAELTQWEPAFGPRAAAMKGEHQTLLAQAAALEERSRQPLAAEELHRAASELIDHVDAHRHRATELLFDTYNVDVSAVD